MSSKKYLLLMVALVLIISFYLLFSVVNTTIYAVIANPSKNRVDLLVSIDDREIFNDIIEYNPFECKVIKVHLRRGFHKLYVHSRKDNLTEEKNIFLLFNQHIVVEYFPKRDDVLSSLFNASDSIFFPEGDGIEEKASFSIRNQLSPFYLE